MPSDDRNHAPRHAPVVWLYQSLSPLKRLQRNLQAKKFHSTLAGKLDQEEQRWHDSQPSSEIQKEFIEHEPDGSEAQRLLGGALEIRSNFSKDNDNR